MFNGYQKAQEVITSLGMSDVFAIARAFGVTIEHGSWYPLTIGEFERRTNTIRVNKWAMAGKPLAKLESRIIAHELGHFFARGLELNTAAEEEFAHSFANGLIGEVQEG
jgi:hypothetical protein